MEKFFYAVFYNSTLTRELELREVPALDPTEPSESDGDR